MCPLPVRKMLAGLRWRWFAEFFTELPGLLAKSLNCSRFKFANRIILDPVAHLDRMAANLAVFHVDLILYRGVQHHRYMLPAMRAREEVLHSPQDTVARAAVGQEDHVASCHA